MVIKAELVWDIIEYMKKPSKQNISVHSAFIWSNDVNEEKRRGYCGVTRKILK